jgi:methionyl-tRNA formyltransferase
MSVTLYLLTKKGYEVLKALIHSENHNSLIDQVVATRDNGNAEDYYDEIKLICEQNNINFYSRNEKLINNSTYSIAIGWRWLIKDIKNLIVLHDSYLPKYRGFSPVVNMLIKGEKYLGVTAIWAVKRMDEGDILFQKKIPIDYPIKIQEAIEIVSSEYVTIVNQIFQKIILKEKLIGIPQDNNMATYSIWRDENDYFINWNNDASAIKRFIDAVGYPYGGARARTMDGEILKVIESEVVDNISAEIPGPGKILMITDSPIVLCGKNAIKLLKIEDLNGNPFQFKKFRTRLI